MSKCPFWSTAKEKFDCYEECPMIEEKIEGEETELCVFKEYLLSSKINFRDIIKDEYNFLNISIYDEKNSNHNY